MTLLRTTCIVILTLLLLALANASSSPSHARSGPLIDAEVWEAIAARGQADALIWLEDYPDLSPAYALPTKEERGQWVYDALRMHATNTQAPLLDYLRARGLSYRSFWLVNAVQTRVDANALAAIGAMPHVKRIVANVPLRALPPAPPPTAQASEAELTPWGVVRVEAPWAWSQGYMGQGVVVAGQDTGYDWDHEALKAAYRGYDAQADRVDHNYNWHDAIHEPVGTTDTSNPCGFDSATPCDDHGHGTHTMGTIVGNDLSPSDPDWPANAENPIGVAPAAKWIGCRNMDRGNGSPATYIECFEWFVAPYPIGGDPLQEGDPAKAPDIINNSWSCPPSEGCTTDKLAIIEPAVNAANAAGILVVASAGNSGPSCGTIDDPPAIYRNAFSVGATALNDVLAVFSSRGPVEIDGQEIIKPDVSAPGVNVRSAIPNDRYDRFSGTSMAAPHTAGVAALLLSADLSLRGKVNRIKAILAQTADPITDFICGGDGDGAPNNRFGAGIVNARRAIESLGQPGFLVGRVTGLLGRPIEGATVKVYDEQGQPLSKMKTNALGGYSITLPDGAYRIEITRFGYRAYNSETLYVVGNQTTTENVRLESWLNFFSLLR
ncbi:MAG: S8 family serine peptidase [Chloroflexi bacterium]|nr:S8 family serine peptidase [Chloroflexota bacterium]